MGLMSEIPHFPSIVGAVWKSCLVRAEAVELGFTRWLTEVAEKHTTDILTMFAVGLKGKNSFCVQAFVWRRNVALHSSKLGLQRGI